MQNVFSDEYYMYLKFSKYQNKFKFKGNIRQIRRPIPPEYWHITPILTILNELYPHYFFTQRERLVVYLQYINHFPFSIGINIYNERLSKLSYYEFHSMLSETIPF